MNQPPQQGAQRPPRAVSLAAFTSSADRFAISPLLVMLATDYGVRFDVAVITASVYFFAYGLSQPVWGMLSDRFGRLAIMKIALIGAVAASILSVMAPTLATLTIARGVTGIMFGAIVPAAITYIGDTTSLQYRQASLSDLMAAVAVGTALATAAAGVLGQLVNWRIVFILAALLALLSLLALTRLTEPQREPSLAPGRALRALAVAPWAWFVVFLAVVEGALVLGLLTLLAPALEFQGVEPGPAGLTVAAYGVATLGFSRLVRPLTAKVSTPRVLLIGGVALCIGLAVVSVHISVLTVIFATVMLGAAWAFLHSGLQSWSTQVAPQARGMAVAFFAGALFAGSALSSAVAGVFAQAGQWAGIFATGTALAVVLTVLATAGMRRYQRQVSR